MAEITIPIVGLGVDGALLFSQRGKGDVKQTGAEVPINLKYTIGLGSLLGVYFAAVLTSSLISRRKMVLTGRLK